ITDKASPHLFRVARQKARHLHFVPDLERELKIPVPAKLLAMLQSQPEHNDPAQVAQFVPGPYLFRFPRAIIGPSVGMPIGLRLPGDLARGCPLLRTDAADARPDGRHAGPRPRLWPA
ncbi:MAG: hypothetical protein ACP5XB_19180, partial [Isosphaeraceae bacterium]